MSESEKTIEYIISAMKSGEITGRHEERRAIINWLGTLGHTALASLIEQEEHRK